MNDDAASQPLISFIYPEHIPAALTILLLTFAFVRLLNHFLRRVSERFVDKRLLIKQISTITTFICYLIAACVATARVFNLSSEALLALSGSIAVMVGFAFKDFAASVLASLTILVTRPFQVGDRVTIGSYYGEVKEIGLRSIQIVTPDDNLVTVPSNMVLTEAVSSSNAGALDCMVVIPFYLAAQSDAEVAKNLVRDALLASRYVYLGKPFQILTSCELLAGVGLVIKLMAMAYVYDARHEKAFASEVTELALVAFASQGIDLAGTRRYEANAAPVVRVLDAAEAARIAS